ncbi:MAG TPA: hypothetical protein VG389_11835 [Myxococcota bacterium]|jgi:hypothetical protein|nr:hypothetical protein [Myxococcota bacterium]
MSVALNVACVPAGDGLRALDDSEIVSADGGDAAAGTAGARGGVHVVSSSASIGGDPYPQSSVAAAFWSSPYDETYVNLQEYDAGDCHLKVFTSETCTLNGLRAGLLSVSGLIRPGSPLDLAPQCGGLYGCEYSFSDMNDDLLAPLATISASAPGDEVPGFFVSATSPEELVVLAPDLAGATSAEGLGFVAGEDLPVSWIPGDGDDITLYFASSLALAPRAVVTCNTSDDGSAMIPAELTGVLASFVMQYLSVSRNRRVEVDGVTLLIARNVSSYLP